MTGKWIQICPYIAHFFYNTLMSIVKYLRLRSKAPPNIYLHRVFRTLWASFIWPTWSRSRLPVIMASIGTVSFAPAYTIWQSIGSKMRRQLQKRCWPRLFAKLVDKRVVSKKPACEQQAGLTAFRNQFLWVYTRVPRQPAIHQSCTTCRWVCRLRWTWRFQFRPNGWFCQSLVPMQKCLHG